MKLLMVATLLFSSITGTAVPCCCDDEQATDSCHSEASVEHNEAEADPHHNSSGGCEDSCCANITIASHFVLPVHSASLRVEPVLFELPLGHPPEVTTPPPRNFSPLTT